MHASNPDFRPPDTAVVERAAAALRLLSDPTRLKIVWALLHGESSVACLADLVEASPTAVSQHLAKLRLSGLVATRREGNYIHYVAVDEHVREVLAQVLEHAEGPAGRSAPVRTRACPIPS